ncbi:MAG: hypothetical protein PF439_05170 [Helicobacteraceae bacterium]|jgi:serine/threonine protein kinase|nr:hypothetical protein [Helicobacteraceae bacterium]
MPSQYQITLNPKYESCRDFCEHIDTHFASQKESVHKARNEIKKIPCDRYSLMVKSFKTPNFLNRLVYTYLRGSKAQKSYDNALKLQALKINTPEPVAIVKELTPTLHKSFFISIAFAYDFTIREPLLDRNFEERELIFQEFARFTAELHEKGVLHKDYSPGNILIKKENGSYLFSIVDINRMQFKVLSAEERFKNFSRLWADEDDMRIIARYYAQYSGLNEERSAEKMIAYDLENKRIRNFKKKIRQKRAK